MNVEEQIAKICYEADRAYCETIGDFSQPRWEEAADWQKERIVHGVDSYLNSWAYDAEDNHIDWMEWKTAAGWKYGPVRSEDKKEHPCLVSYEELPAEQRRKDIMLVTIIQVFRVQPISPGSTLF